VSDMFAGFTFGTTMHGFFILTVAFSGGMVVAEGGGVEGERRRVGIGETRRRHAGGGGGCSGRELVGSGGKWRVWWGKWRDMGKTGGKAVVSLPRGPGR
jgi:hypothetical protein